MKEKLKTEISLQKYEDLLMAEAKLNLLEWGGVDNWEYYGLALENLDEEYENVEKVIEKLVAIEEQK